MTPTNFSMKGRFPDRPLEYPTVTAWLLAGGTRDWRSLGAGYLIGWGLLPFSLFGAIGGALTGAVAGFSGSLATVDAVTALPVIGPFVTWVWAGLAGILGGLIGFFLGAALGAVAGFFIIPGVIIAAAAAAGGILQVMIVFSLALIVTVLLALGFTVWTIISEGPRTGISGYRRMSRREAEFLVPLVQDCAARLGCLNVPRILIDDDGDPQAYALTRHIVLTRGLLEMTEADETALAGVICHELMHWRNADTVSSLITKGLALPAYALYNLAHQTHDNAIVVVLLLPLRFVLRYAFLPLRARESRDGEYRADQGAVFAGLAAGLSAALTGFRELEPGRSGWDEAICATHPPIELRLERLEPYLNIEPEPQPSIQLPHNPVPEDSAEEDHAHEPSAS
jgi:Zn-dependent protease with chaperone function